MQDFILFLKRVIESIHVFSCFKVKKTFMFFLAQEILMGFFFLQKGYPVFFFGAKNIHGGFFAQ